MTSNATPKQRAYLHVRGLFDETLPRVTMPSAENIANQVDWGAPEIERDNVDRAIKLFKAQPNKNYDVLHLIEELNFEFLVGGKSGKPNDPAVLDTKSSLRERREKRKQRVAL